MEKLPDWRFLVIGDKVTNAEGKQYAFFFKEKGTDQAIKTLVQAFLESVKKDHGTVTGWGAKRLMVFFKRYVEREHPFHIQGILNFTTKDLLENLIDFRCTSFMLLMSDQYDEKGFPLLETISLDNAETPATTNPVPTQIKKQPIDRPLSYLSLFATALNGDLSSAQEQYETLLPVKDKPSVLDDEIINRIIRLHEEKNEFIENYERQFQLWRQEKLTPNQLREIDGLEEKLPLLKEVNDKVLKLAYGIQPYTIDKIIAMDPGELAMLHLSGKLKRPFEEKSKRVARFLVFTDQRCQTANLQLAFLFKEHGTDLEIKALLGAFFQKLIEKFNTLQGWKAKHLMRFFKNFVEFEDISYVERTMDFDTEQLRKEGLSLQTDSYLRIWCDQFDEDGCLLLETVYFSESEVSEKAAISNHHTPPPLPILTVNKPFMRTFLSSTPPCAALGVIEERGVEIGFLAMRPEKNIPENVLAKGFNFGHSLIGTSEYTLIQFAFEFYGFGTYYVLLNPNTILVQTILTKMIESGNYFFLALNPDKSVSTFKADIGQENLAGLRTNFPKIQAATTNNEQYNRGLHYFHQAPDPDGKLLNWVCRDNMDFLDLKLEQNRLDLNPR